MGSEMCIRDRVKGYRSSLGQVAWNEQVVELRFASFPNEQDWNGRSLQNLFSRLAQKFFLETGVTMSAKNNQVSA